MEEFTMPSAAEAYELTSIRRKDKEKEIMIEELEAIKELISWSIQNGKDYCFWHYGISLAAQEYLRDLGYIVSVDVKARDGYAYKSLIEWSPISRTQFREELSKSKGECK